MPPWKQIGGCGFPCSTNPKSSVFDILSIAPFRSLYSLSRRPCTLEDFGTLPRLWRLVPGHLKRQRIVHDLADGENTARPAGRSAPIGEETSERYEYITAQVIMIEDACKKYACARTVKAADKSLIRSGQCSTIATCFRLFSGVIECNAKTIRNSS